MLLKRKLKELITKLKERRYTKKSKILENKSKLYNNRLLWRFWKMQMLFVVPMQGLLIVSSKDISIRGYLI